jgi:membrane-bound serine protease (ClpP class)
MLAMEIFVLPGFGIMGISGIILVLASLGLATMEKAPSSPAEWMTFGERLMTYGGTLCVACVFAVALARYLPKIPYANRLMLVPPSDNPEMEAQAQLPGAEQAAALLGQVGAATSMLRPAGMAKIGDAYVDVVTEGDFIAPGTPIQVIEVEGTRIVVKKV